VRRAENDQETCGAGMHQLGQQTVRVGVDPDYQDSYAVSETIPLVIASMQQSEVVGSFLGPHAY
jgi:hypothetical protein